MVSLGLVLLSLTTLAEGSTVGLPVLATGLLVAALSIAQHVYRERRWRAGVTAWGGQVEPDDDDGGSDA